MQGSSATPQIISKRLRYHVVVDDGHRASDESLGRASKRPHLEDSNRLDSAGDENNDIFDCANEEDDEDTEKVRLSMIQSAPRLKLI